MADEIAVHRQTKYADFRLTIRNAQGVAANFYSFAAEAEEEIAFIMQGWGQTARALAQQYAPVSDVHPPPGYPGFLRDHIRLTFSEHGLSFELGAYAEDYDAIGENLYAIFQEYGSSRNDPQPFLNPAYHDSTIEFEPQVSRALADLARRRSAR